MNLTGMYTSLERSKKLISLKSLSHVTITALRINLCDFCRGEFGTPSLFYLLKKIFITILYGKQTHIKHYED
jgi:hypothetical protein